MLRMLYCCVNNFNSIFDFFRPLLSRLLREMKKSATSRKQDSNHRTQTSTTINSLLTAFIDHVNSNFSIYCDILIHFIWNIHFVRFIFRTWKTSIILSKRNPFLSIFLILNLTVMSLKVMIFVKYFKMYQNSKQINLLKFLFDL